MPKNSRVKEREDNEIGMPKSLAKGKLQKSLTKGRPKESFKQRKATGSLNKGRSKGKLWLVINYFFGYVHFWLVMSPHWLVRARPWLVMRPLSDNGPLGWSWPPLAGHGPFWVLLFVL
jgi:hypothetical protein